MSADAWRVCPQCKLREEASVEEEEKAAVQAYGKVPPEEWRAMTAKTSHRRSHPEYNRETFREDYEIYMSSSGEFSVGYSGCCAICGLYHSFEHSEKVKIKL